MTIFTDKMEATTRAPKDFFSGLPHATEVREGRYGELDYQSRKAIARELYCRGLIKTDSTATAKAYLMTVLMEPSDNTDDKIAKLEEEFIMYRQDMDASINELMSSTNDSIKSLKKEFAEYKKSVENALEEIVDMLVKPRQK